MLDSISWQCRCGQLGISIALSISSTIACSQTTVSAQNIILDGTLGQAKILPGHTYEILQSAGRTVDRNLFHSFKQFNLDAGEIAIFQSDPNIKNILSRVTGESASLINGQISTTSSNVNLYLINPNGIIFGPDASIIIGSANKGSFVATTANAIQFGGRGSFIASKSQTDVSLLRVNPSAFLFNQIVAGSITNQARLQVKEGQSLILLGGNLQLNGGALIAPGGRVELGSIADNGTVKLNANGSILRLNFPLGVQRGDISLNRSAEVNVRAQTGGSIAINAGNLNLNGGSTLRAGIATGLGNVNSKAGNIQINVTEAINLLNSSFIVNTIQPEAVGKGGNINITTNTLSGINGSQISASTSGKGDAGNVIIRAGSIVSFDGVDSDNFSGGVYSRVENGAVGNAGNINIMAGSLLVTNGARLTTSTLGKGNAGNVIIHATSVASFDGVGSNGLSSGVFSSVGVNALGGKGGNINITTDGLLSISNGALVGASTRGSGNGGNITLNTNRLELVKGGQVITTSRSIGRAGNITVNATDSVTLSGNDPTYTDRFNQFGGARVLNAGAVSGLFANTTRNSTDQGGNVRINTGQLIVQDGAEVNASSRSLGNAGQIIINADSILLDNQGKLTASTASGAGGNIILTVQDLLLMRHNSLISTAAGTNRAGGGGKGGDIAINSRLIVAVPSENSDIVANAFDGSGGNIKITTQGIFGIEPRNRSTPLSDITASSDFGVNGTVQINTPDVNPSRGLIQLPSQVVDAERLIDRRCDPTDQNAQRSSFIVTGRGGLPPNPGDVLRDDALFVDWVTLNSDSVKKTYPVTAAPNHSTPKPLVEAQGWVVNENGQIILTAQSSTATAHGSEFDSVECLVKKSEE